MFSGTPDRYFRAFDDRDGKVLWESPRLNDVPNAFPITYMVDGKQYIAMPVGNPGLQGNTALFTAPEVEGPRRSSLLAESNNSCASARLICPGARWLSAESSDCDGGSPSPSLAGGG